MRQRPRGRSSPAPVELQPVGSGALQSTGQGAAGVDGAASHAGRNLGVCGCGRWVGECAVWLLVGGWWLVGSYILCELM